MSSLSRSPGPQGGGVYATTAEPPSGLLNSLSALVASYALVEATAGEGRR
ncbi:hypothetical protein [Mycobacterium sp. Root135]|nr:hypothetical protein [Mycobacterium sp. Root135]